MKTQNLIPIDSFSLGINNQYIPLSDKGILINSKGVLASNSTITIGKHYILVMSLNQELNVQVVELDDAFFDGSKAHLILYGQKNSEMVFLKTKLLEDDSYATQDWWLIDSHIAIQIIERLQVLEYCFA